jgi:hypothetical protein
VALGIVAVGTFGSWYLWANRWFTGPIKHIEAVAAEASSAAYGEYDGVKAKAGMAVEEA